MVAVHTDAAAVGSVGAGCCAGRAVADRAGAGATVVGCSAGTAVSGAAGAEAGAIVLVVGPDEVYTAPVAMVRREELGRLELGGSNDKAAAAPDPAGKDVASGNLRMMSDMGTKCMWSWKEIRMPPLLAMDCSTRPGPWLITYCEFAVG